MKIENIEKLQILPRTLTEYNIPRASQLDFEFIKCEDMLNANIHRGVELIKDMLSIANFVATNTYHEF